MSGLENIGDAKFKSCGVRTNMTEQDWLDRAKEQAVFARVTAAILNMTDEQLEQYSWGLAESERDSTEATIELMEWCQEWAKSYQSAFLLADNVTARMIAVCERRCGRDTMEKAYRQ